MLLKTLSEQRLELPIRVHYTSYKCCSYSFVRAVLSWGTKQSHKQHREEIKADASGKACTAYGINRDSILNELSYFHVCDGSLLPDIMHDVLEGGLQYEVKLMLGMMVGEYFTL